MISLPRMNGTVRFALAALTILTVIAIGASLLVGAISPGPEQPIPFSHKLHVTSKQINCFFCHQFAAESSSAGIPPVEKCVLCHKVIATRFPPIAKIFSYYDRGQSIPWVRVARLADFVRFSHQAHLARRIDCSRCHGNIAQMDRVRLVHRFKMDFCVSCHWESKVSVDCYTCHY